MNVKELKELLDKYPDDVEVLMCVEAGQVKIGIDPVWSGIIDGVLLLVET